MIYWIVFLFLEYILLLTFTSSKKTGARTFILFLIILLAVYFAGFRDCLGMDYEGYRNNCERDRLLSDASWLIDEPLYELVRNFCATTQFSAVIFFIVFAALTSVPTLIVYSKYENFFLAGFVYFTYTGLYLFSFNIVRQFASAGLLVLAAYYLLKDDKKGKLIFVALVLLSALFHKSALFFLPVMFLGTKSYNPHLIVILVVLSFILPVTQIMGLGRIVEVLNMMDYDIYIDYSTSTISKYSLTNLYLHIMMIPFLFRAKEVASLKNGNMYVFAIKMYAICLMCNNLAANDVAIAYRIAIMFSMYIPLVFSILPIIIGNRQLGNVLIIVPLLILFFAIGLSNPLVVPDKMLPLNSIWDAVYQKFQ